MHEYKVQNIDLLKIDVEKSELDVLEFQRTGQKVNRLSLKYMI